MADIDRRALARAITEAANASVEDLLAGRVAYEEHPIARIALTGSPGSGKSTLAGELARRRIAEDAARYIGVLAIDPSSRYSGGAILGDRIRMDSDSADPRLYIRSLVSRHTGEGLADNISILLNLLGHYGFTECITETVGVGQVDCAVRDLSDTVVLVVNPESGDVIQTMKSGIMEAADIYVVNKADLPGSDKIVTALRSRGGKPREPGWDPPVLETSFKNPESVQALASSIDAHLEWRASQVDAVAVARQRRGYRFLALAQRHFRELLDAADLETTEADELMDAIARSFAQLAATARTQK